MADYPMVESKQPGFKIRVTYQNCGTGNCSKLQGGTLYPLDLCKLLGITDEELIACIEEEKKCLHACSAGSEECGETKKKMPQTGLTIDTVGSK